MKHSPQTRQYRTMRRISLLAVCFLVLIVTALIDARYATGQAILMAAALLVYALPFGRVNRQLQKQLDAAARKLDSDSLSFLDSTLPVAAIRRNGALVWYNEAFHELIGQGPAPGRDIREAIPGFQPQKFTEPDLMDGVSVSHAQRAFRVYASPLRELGQKNDLLLLTFFDVSEHKALQAEYKASRPVVAHIIIDNLDEISQNARESDKAMVVGGVDNVLSAWAAPTGGILQLTERGRYLFVFEERYLPGFIADKFSVLDSVRTLGENGALEPTISIGVGAGGESFADNNELARQALDLTLGRGGDQATVKQGASLEFFGGKTKTVERRTKVKARIMAQSLAEFLDEATSVLIMGHRFADFDAVGAAVGVARLAMAKNKPVNIVIDRETSPALSLIEHVEHLPEYEGVFVPPLTALDLVTSSTLLVVVDTHNPELLESSELVGNAAHVVLIDHHRRMASCIESDLAYHEPYASSASELVCELAQYSTGGNALRKREAEAMLAGIVLDTNNFAFRTSFRTFEAAAFLKKMGGDTIEVKKLFQVDFDSYSDRTQLISAAHRYERITVLASWNGPDHPGMGVVAAQAADEMLDIEGVEASFVLFQRREKTYISARSLGTINVQLIMEALGGGGHATNAGAQVEAPLEEARKALCDAISRSLRENYPDLL